MPPVRWKFITMVTIFCVAQRTDAEHMQNEMSMVTSDGWKPIVGTRSHNKQPDEITHYRNPSLSKEEVIKAEAPTTKKVTQKIDKSTSVSPMAGSTFQYVFQTPGIIAKGKIPPHSKNPTGTHQYFILPTHGTHGPHIPLGSVSHGRPAQFGIIKKVPMIMQQTNKRTKPQRQQQQTSYSNRDEVYVPAPLNLNSGSYAFFMQSQKNMKPRDTPGVILGTKQYTLNQPHGHIDFTKHFPSGDTTFKQYVTPQQLQILKGQPLQQDFKFKYSQGGHDYTFSNLVPPPLLKQFGGKLQNKQVQSSTTTRENIIPIATEALIHDRIISGHNSANVLQTNGIKTHFKNPSLDIQVTKEKLKTFHNTIPTTYNAHIDEYVDYDYHYLKRPTEANKLQTYDVTEGKWFEEATPILFKPSTTYAPKKRPQSDNFEPQILQLQLPPFLPTPVRPETIPPTAPTQEDVDSTVFTKPKKRPTETVTQYFDVKEVSTHYPIVGNPNFISINEITSDLTTTVRPSSTTEEVVSIKPSRGKNGHRRRRPSNRITTTTEEAVTDNYDSQKTGDSEANNSEETERPVRQRRPSRYRSSTPASSEEEDRPKNRNRQRYNIRKRVRPTQHEEPVTATTLRAQQEETTEVLPIVNHFTTMSYEAEKEMQGHFETSKVQSQEYDSDSEETPTTFRAPSIKEYYTTTVTNENSAQEPYDSAEEFGEIITEIPKRIRIYKTTTEIPATTTTHRYEETTIIKEEPTTTPTPTTTTTTTEATTKAQRTRGRPNYNKYEPSHRPKFSVKDYRQRLHGLTSTSTTEGPVRSSTEYSTKARFSNKYRRPSITTLPADEDSVTEPIRTKFLPKESRYSSTVAPSGNIITENNIKPINTRLRPFGRSRTTTTTESSATAKVSIRPNLFGNRRRPPTLNLRTRI